MVGPPLIRKLEEMRVGQPIRDIGPDHKYKEGTPTMGGLLILLSLLVSVWAGNIPRMSVTYRYKRPSMTSLDRQCSVILFCVTVLTVAEESSPPPSKVKTMLLGCRLGDE